ncbi:substrate-binding domain-containing protein, partial [Escherichia coli]|uniref:substrate-binding domain-containing protein n=1 Tax=Escherichia coli TaxID=562 RepID=UPI00159B8D67
GLGDLFSDASEHVLALDGIAVVVNRQNPSNHLSLSDLGRLYSGDQQAWSGDASALGQVVLFARDERSGTFDTFDSAV